MNIKIKDTHTLSLIEHIHKAGGHCFIVGGFIRDNILGIYSEDIDIEVFNISNELLKEIILEQGYDIYEVFGVVQIKGLKTQFATPRTEVSTGIGYKEFEINLNPNLSIKGAATRRDLTSNSIYYDLINNKVIDPYNGLRDIKNKILSRNTEHYKEDPLRALRTLRFSYKYNFSINDLTLKDMPLMLNHINTINNTILNKELNKIFDLVDREVFYKDFLKLSKNEFKYIVREDIWKN
ncbi:MAG: hypothetical protein ACK5HS_02795 [Mycoplasmatales bacterium]